MSSTVSATSAAASSTDLASAVSSAASNQSLNQNDFLTLFMAQLKYQDPTNPMQSYEMASQLAQFSSLEQLTQANTNLQKLQSYVSSSTNAEMMGLIGKEVTGTSDAVQLKNGKASPISYQLDSQSNVVISITDSNDNPIRTVRLSGQAAGNQSYTWDGKNDSGQAVAAGNYTCTVQSVDSTGSATDLTTSISGQVNAFRLVQGVPYLILNSSDGLELPISNIVEVSNQSTGG
jgi:flagellar basal-body rod modification protein FlgD